ncbi:MAG: tRNA lysidine(34) synthetase TilS, partial [Candidatus Marinimicrobia bacterium]|nr:tRNA lysidine(34) synthetase TilS [Candidatus Neomarinimicrobiota bacterium]
PVSEYSKQPNRSNVEFIDLDKIDGEVKLRRWRLGDRIRPLGLEHSKKVSDLFVDLKIPRIRKDRIPLLVCNEKIIWVCGLKLSDSFKITSETTTILKLRYEEV